MDQKKEIPKIHGIWFAKTPMKRLEAWNLRERDHGQKGLGSF
jgi:hypothetical protein